jgi:heme exporter protein A
LNASLLFDGVTCARGGRVLFEHLSFVLGAGEGALVTGPNGIGKSSLVRVAAGLLPPVSGRVEVTGDRALLTEASALDADLTLAGALGFWTAIDRRPDAVGAALAAFDLAPLADVPVRLLSTGQRRRAALARVAASGAGIWLLDEPANGLDAGAVGLLETAIAAHCARGGAVLIATHLPIAVPDAQSIILGGAS